MLDGMTVFFCSKCDSKLIPLSELKAKIKSRTLAELHGLAKASQRPSSIDCGICGGQMRLVQKAESAIPLDVCLSCEAIWFGGAQSEYERFLLEELSLKPSTKSMLSQDRVGGIANDFAFAQVHGPLFLSNRSSVERPEDSRFPSIASGYIFFLIFITSFVAFKNRSVFESLLLTTLQPAAKQVLTTFSSFFVHADWFHLLGNLFFYYQFADTVERRSGTKVFLSLIAVSQVVSSALFLALNWGRAAGTLGASVGIMAFMTYAVTGDPYRPMRLFGRIPHTFRAYSFSISAWIYFMLFLLNDLRGINRQMMGATNVSHIGHFVGILVGLVIYHLSPPPAAPEKPVVQTPTNINY